MPEIEGRVWDELYDKSIYVEGTGEGLDVTAVNDTTAVSVVLNVDQVRKLRLLLQRYERGVARG